MVCHMTLVHSTVANAHEILRTHSDVIKKVFLSVAFVGVGVKVYHKYMARQRRERWNKAGKDVVVLHQFDRGTVAPNLSPFALKLETYLRMTGIKYVVDTDEPMGVEKGKCPWITINGQELADSELIIDFLDRHFQKSLGNFSAEQHAIGRAVQVMLDQHTIQYVAYKRYVLDDMRHVVKMLSKRYRCYATYMKFLFAPKMRKYFWITGVGRFTEQEVMFFLKRDMRALDDILGDKLFLFGTEPSVYDAAVFAEVTQIIYCCAPQIEEYVRSHHRRLVAYHERMKEKYWADWNQNLAE